MYILVLVIRDNIYIYDMVFVVSVCVDNILLKMSFWLKHVKDEKLKTQALPITLDGG
jgi:hypothetical protein